MFNLPAGFEPTDEYAKSKLGMSLADYYKNNPGAQDAFNNSPSQIAKRNADQMAADKQAQAAQAAKNQAANDARFAQDKTDLTNFNTGFQTAVPNIINSTSDKYHLGDLLGQTNDLGTRVKDLQTNMYGTGAGGYANSGQVDKAISTNYLPRYQQAVTNLNNGTQLAQGEENMQITPYTTEATLLNERLARESTAYSQEQQKELDTLVAQMNAGVQLTDAQIQQATTLATAEQHYQETLATIQGNKDVANITNERFRAIGAGGIYDPLTGQVIQGVKSAGSGATGSTGGTH